MLVTSEPPPIGLLEPDLLVSLGGGAPPVESEPSLLLLSAFSTALACSLPVLCASALTVGLEACLAGAACMDSPAGDEEAGAAAAVLAEDPATPTAGAAAAGRPLTSITCLAGTEAMFLAEPLTQCPSSSPMRSASSSTPSSANSPLLARSLAARPPSPSHQPPGEAAPNPLSAPRAGMRNSAAGCEPCSITPPAAASE